MPWRRKRIGPLLARADAARRHGDWRAVAAAFEAVLAIRPDDAAIWVQLGHAARELGDHGRAADAYARAIMLEPRNADTHLVQGHLRKVRGDRPGAIASYAQAVALDPDADAARRELIAMGARDALPRSAFDLDRRGRADAAVQVALRELGEALVRRDAVSTFPISAYADFRRVYPVLPPPASGPRPAIRVRIDAVGVVPAYLRATLLSLIDQSSGDWEADVLQDVLIAGHPVASFACLDSRIAFVDAVAPQLPDRRWTLSLRAGVVLDPQAIAWFAFVAERSGADAVIADHDVMLDDPHAGRQHGAPVFGGVPDVDLMLATTTPPIALLTRGAPAGSIREELLSVLSDGRVAHIPRVLASGLVLPDHAATAPAVDGRSPDERAVPPAAPGAGTQHGRVEISSIAGRLVAVSRSDGRTERLLVVMPTRDQPELVREAVDSLIAHAAEPERLRILVVDNRSQTPEARRTLDMLRTYRSVEVRSHDEPFNWSRINNVSVAGATEGSLLFINDDTRMLTSEWDRILLGALERRDVGVVGARLLYPDRTLQHSGVLLGIDGMPRLEGTGASENDPGPAGRWQNAHSVGAVMGAFLAIRRDLFEELGGFDERRLSIGFNEVDMCLRVRASGRTILYQPAIEVIHHESKTRGHNVTWDRVAWDQGEIRTLRDRWGDALDRDPGYNPHWSRGPVPFDGLREPPVSEILAWIDASATGAPWRIDVAGRGGTRGDGIGRPSPSSAVAWTGTD